MVFGERFDSMDNPDYVTIANAWTTFFRTSAPAFQVTRSLYCIMSVSMCFQHFGMLLFKRQQ